MMTVENSCTHQIRFEVAPGSGSRRRLVIALDGDDEVFRDQLNTDDDRDRRRFLGRLAELVDVDSGSLEALAIDLVAGADGADELLSASVGEGGVGAPSNGARNQATQLVEMVTQGEGVEVFKTPKGEAFIIVPVGDHRDTLQLSGKPFRRWVAREFYERSRTVPSSQALKEAIAVIEAQALFEDEEHEVFLRVAEADGAIYVDLADAERHCVKITADSVSVVTDPPVRFHRPKGMLPLPVPRLDQQPGSLEELRNFLNVNDADWVLVMGWLVGAVRPSGPYPHLRICGEHGTAKTTSCKVLRGLIDPATPEDRGEPGSVRDMMIGSQKAWILAFDNVSSLTPSQSDALCRLSTGGGFATRALFTDSEEAVFEAERPVISTGIGEYITRSDLLDRTLPVQLEPIPETRRRTEKEFWAAYDEAVPRILGVLYAAVSCALRNLATTHLDRHPRMADFAHWVVAAEPALGIASGSFLDLYLQVHRAQGEVALDASLIGRPIIEFVRQQQQQTWRGTATALLALLEQQVSESTKRQKNWPKSSQALGSQLREIAPRLRSAGMDIDFATSGSRWITLALVGADTASVTPPDAEDHSPEPTATPPRARPQPTPQAPFAPDTRLRPDAGDGHDASARGSFRGGVDGWREERI